MTVLQFQRPIDTPDDHGEAAPKWLHPHDPRTTPNVSEAVAAYAAVAVSGAIVGAIITAAVFLAVS
jgi:hypothetical protein